MKYGLLTYEDTPAGTNIGDYIQSLAARQYIPNSDYLINREHLNDVTDGPIKVIMNGWYMHHPENWPPSESIDPLYVAFHANSSHIQKMLTPKGIAHLKKYEPIGCRDAFTAEALNKRGISAYISGCLTLTLDKYRVPDKERNDIIYIVDPIFNVQSFRDAFTNIEIAIHYWGQFRFLGSIKRYKMLKKMIDQDILRRAEWRHHMLYPNKMSDKDRFDLAEDLLNEYAHARGVITSRIHCALPCLALGTPVIFINSFTDPSNLSRLEGLTNLFHTVNVNFKTGEIHTNLKLNNGKITSNSFIPNKNDYLMYANSLRDKCFAFINQCET